MYSQFNKTRNIWLFLSVDVLLITGSFLGAFLLRFDFTLPPEYVPRIGYYLGIILFSKLISFFMFGLYRGMWRYTSISDLLNIIKGSSLGTLFTLALVGLTFGLAEFPRSVLFIDYFLTTILVAVSRISVRLYFSNYFQNTENLPAVKSPGMVKKKLLIIGAGYSSEKIIREIRDNSAMKYTVVGLLDDNKSKVGATIHSIPIIGKIEDLPSLHIVYDEILICIPSATNVEMRRIVAVCKSVGRRFRTVPPFSELIDGKVSIKSVREVSIADLLGRKEVNLDRSAISHYLYGKRVLVTGAGGSIGSELVKQCLTFEPDFLILLDQSEHNLFKIDKECHSATTSLAFQPILGDIRDKETLSRVFASFKPDVVFHAAAYKHVPMQEIHPWEAVLTNIQGTLNLIDVCEEYGVNRFVLVSTDKAVNPTNIMGSTKRVAEILIQGKSKTSQVKYMAVRFGNVIGSSGSVIITFQEQIRRGGPITITDPNVERYFMSISEAAQLILQAGAMGRGGEIFVLDMGNPVKVKDIAYELIRLSGLKPELDIPIEYIGMRPGEKMYEELITKEEDIVDTAHEKIMVLRNGYSHSWNYIRERTEKIIASAQSYDSSIIIKSLQEYIPEYTPKRPASFSLKPDIRTKRSTFNT